MTDSWEWRVRETFPGHVLFNLHQAGQYLKWISIKYGATVISQLLVSDNHAYFSCLFSITSAILPSMHLRPPQLNLTFQNKRRLSSLTSTMDYPHPHINSASSNPIPLCNCNCSTSHVITIQELRNLHIANNCFVVSCLKDTSATVRCY